MRRRVLTDALSQGMAATWERRAAMFEAAMWRPGDSVGRTTPADRRAHDAEMAAIARACRHRGQLGAENVWDVADLLEEVA